MTETNIPKNNDLSVKGTQSSPENQTETLEQLAESIGSTSKKSTASASKFSSQKSPKSAVSKIPVSKTAIIALLLALGSAAGVAAIHYLHNLESARQSETLFTQLTTLNNASEQRIEKLLSEQQAKTSQQVDVAVNELKKTSQSRITQLEQTLAALKQNQPSDWLLHEADYLVRIATRTLWLEQDTTAAIALLSDAEARIQELNDPQYLAIRQLIREDIATLTLLPSLATEDVILTLLAMSKQLPQLSFAMAKIPDSQVAEADLELTENTSDWRSNLAKTWQKFLKDFITVRRRTGDVEPLMSPQYQQNLKENLALKLQQAQWAASEQESAIFMQTIEDIQQWLTQYFDLGHLETAKFYQAMQLLKSETISYDYPSQLVSLAAIREVIAVKPSSPSQVKDEQPNTLPTRDAKDSQEQASPEEKTNKLEDNIPLPVQNKTSEDA